MEKKKKVNIKKDDVKQEEKQIVAISKVIESKEIAPVDVFAKLDRGQLDLIKRTIAKGANDDELKMFLQVCKGANLNPFMKQVYLVPRWDSKEGKEIRAIQVSIDGFRAIAEESGNYAGNDDPIFKWDKDNKPVEASVTVYKIVQGVRCPFTATARWTEYYPGDKIGFMWKTKPHIMLGKCAEALALRKAFPKLLSGFYESAEMDSNKSPEDKAKDDVQKGFLKLQKIVGTFEEKQCIEYKEKIEKSELYDKKQKQELITLIEKRIEEIKK